MHVHWLTITKYITGSDFHYGWGLPHCITSWHNLWDLPPTYLTRWSRHTWRGQKGWVYFHIFGPFHIVLRNRAEDETTHPSAFPPRPVDNLELSVNPDVLGLWEATAISWESTQIWREHTKAPFPMAQKNCFYFPKFCHTSSTWSQHDDISRRNGESEGYLACPRGGQTPLVVASGERKKAAF